MKYLRFGDWSKLEKSVNYMTMPYDLQDDFNFYVNNEGYDKAIERFADYLEGGISVFEIDIDNLPKLNDLELVKSMIVRLDKPIYKIEATQIGVGQDKEPVVVNCKLIRKRLISQNKLIDKAVAIVKKHCSIAEYNEDNKNSDYHEFTEENVILNKTKELMNIYDTQLLGYCYKDYKKLPSMKTYNFYGWKFADKIDNF